MAESIAVVILAGGRSSRMGEDKSFLPLHGEPVIQHVIRRVKTLGFPILLSTNQPEAYQQLNLPMFPDVIPERGSLGGLYSALIHSPAAYTLCVACDMPFLNPDLLRELIALRSGCDVVVPRIDGRPQGLHAVYSQSCRLSIRRRIERGDLKISQLYADLRTRFVEEDHLRRFDPELRSFVNINTPAEFTRARQLDPQPESDTS
jgi:molybdenum cofactor guanylyltransferase